MISPGIPSHLLNATAQVYKEIATPGTFGESNKVLRAVGTSVRCRVDGKSFRNEKQDGGLMVASTYYDVFINGSPTIPVDDNFWLRVVTDAGQTLVLQIDSQANPGMMNHHLELVGVQRNPTIPFEVAP